MTMKTASIVDLKKNISAYLAMAQQGEDIQVLKRNVPVAHLVGIASGRGNRTKLGFAAGSVLIQSDLTEPFVAASEWDMLKGGGAAG